MKALKTTFKTWKIVLKSAFWPTFFILTFTIVSGVLTGLITYAWNLFLENVFELTTGNIVINYVIPSFILLITLYCANSIFNAVLSFLRPNFVEKIKIAVLSKVHKMVDKIPLEEYENSSTYNNIYIASNFINNPKFMIFFFSSLTVVNLIFTLISVITVLAIIHPLLILVALFSVVPTFIVRLLRGSKYYDMRLYNTPKLRIKDYLWGLLVGVDSLKEIRTYNFGDYLQTKWTNYSKEVADEEWDFSKRSAIIQFAIDFFKVFGLGLGVLFLVYLLFNQIITPGNFGAAIITFRALQSGFQSILIQVSNLANNTPFVNKLVEYIEKAQNYQKENKESFVGLQKEIKLENVFFKYPHNDNIILNDINLNIKNKEMIAIVGDNGSGKTTLIKVLMGLFRPIKGAVYYDDVDISKFDQSIYKDTSIVFQDFTRYALTLRENVAISDVKNLNNENKINLILDRVDFDKGDLNTYLKKDFGGIELSGGEWQKIVIARALFKDSNLIIFDEPTAKIDPVLEYKIFEDIRKLSKNRTSIFISHRIGPTKMADKIIVLKNGRIVESGTYDELMSKKGEYYSLYQTQSQWYV